MILTPNAGKPQPNQATANERELARMEKTAAIGVS